MLLIRSSITCHVSHESSDLSAGWIDELRMMVLGNPLERIALAIVNQMKAAWIVGRDFRSSLQRWYYERRNLRDGSLDHLCTESGNFLPNVRDHRWLPVA
jgi:hypothetical protein